MERHVRRAQAPTLGPVTRVGACGLPPVAPQLAPRGRSAAETTRMLNDRSGGGLKGEGPARGEVGGVFSVRGGDPGLGGNCNRVEREVAPRKYSTAGCIGGDAAPR